MGEVKRYDSFADLIGQQALARSKGIALRYESGGQIASVAWDELAALVKHRASELAEEDARCEAIVCDGSLDNVVEIFACAQAGLQAVMISGGATGDELREQALAGDADAIWPATRANETMLAYKDVPRGCVRAGQLLFFTSGTTSRAKPVALTQASLLASAWNGSMLLPLSQDDVVLNLLPLSHVFGFVCGLLWGLTCGASVTLGRGKRHLFDDAHFFNPTVMPLVPALLQALVDHRLLNPRLRMVLTGAASCPKELVRRVRESDIEIHCGYGLTETSSGVALSLGEDTDAFAICPADRVCISAEGEVLVSSELCMMEGYYADEARTLQALRNGELHTGDRGFLDDTGHLHISGRMDNVITLANGVKVNVEECERKVRAALGENDVAVVYMDGSFVMVCGNEVQGFEGDDALLNRVNACLGSESRDARIAKVLALGHPLWRSASGTVQRWRVESEVRAWQRSKK